jgi:hypothetical protein
MQKHANIGRFAKIIKLLEDRPTRFDAKDLPDYSDPSDRFNANMQSILEDLLDCSDPYRIDSTQTCRKILEDLSDYSDP